jgi:pyruvate dehydrogenase E2 component (dihydrolipoamide acetyltransferase)
MARLLRMPEIAANTVEAVLSEWPLPVNATFVAGDAIATVETDKAVVDVPADADGVLLRTLIEPGKSVSVGTAMAVIGEPGEVIDNIDALVERLTADATQVAMSPVAAVTEAARVFASPLARRIAKENGLAVADIHGTGPGGRIIRDDVNRALAAHAIAVPEKTPQATQTAPAPQEPVSRPEQVSRPEPAAYHDTDYHDIAHSPMRRAIASRLTEGTREAPVFTIRGSARVDALLALRADVNEAVGVRVSINDLIVAAAARAHVAVPEMNVMWMPDAVRSFRSVDIAVAVATDTGLVTPVLRDVQAKTLSVLAAQSADLVNRARSRALRQHELEGGTMTVTNLGVFGTEDFTAVINPPQAAILAVGAARPAAVVSGGEIGVATVLRVTLSVDHRPIDGAIAARWMAAFLALLEAPLRILA